MVDVGKTVEGLWRIVDSFITTPEEKAAKKAEITNKLFELQKQNEEAINVEVEAKAKVIAAEMAQDDQFTKRARPTVVYAGLLCIMLVHVFLPIVGYIASFWMADIEMPKIELPTDFWVTWGGVVGLWTIGRSTEKNGIKNRLTKIITGSK